VLSIFVCPNGNWTARLLPCRHTSFPVTTTCE
jgi:hypothetical protein